MLFFVEKAQMPNNAHCDQPTVTSKSNAYQKGVSLIEVLITVVVMAMGFLASAQMQVQGLRSNMNSQYQSQALLLAGEIMDRMHDNADGVAAGHYDSKNTGTSTDPNCTATGCTAAELAALDLFNWSANLIALRGETGFIPRLPKDSSGSPASGSISSPNDGVYTITLNWKEPVSGTETLQSLAVNFAP